MQGSLHRRKRENIQHWSMRRFVRASSVVSPSKAPFIFPQRCTSVPLDGEDVVPSVDFTTIPPSPRRSPNKRDIEVKRAPSLPPMASDSMEVDEGELRSDGSTHSGDALPNQRKFPAFNYTVNFATPIASKRTIYPLMTPLSPLTPLPPTPFTGRLQKAQSIPQETLHGLEDEMDTDADSLTNIPTSPTGATSTLDFSTAKSSASCEPLPRASSRPSSVASSLTSELTSIEDITDLPNLSQELMPPPAVPPLERQEDTVAGSSTQSGQKSLPPAHSTATSSSTSNPAVPTSVFANRPGGPQKKRSTIAGAMKPRPVSSTSAVPRRVTRSLSVNKTSGDIPQEDGVSRREFNGQIRPYVPRTTAVAPIPSNPTPTAISKHGPAAPQGRPTSSSTLIPPTAGKLKQTSLNMFIRLKSAATTSTTATTASGPAHVSTSTVTAAGPSKLAPLPSPSKIPLPVSPMKHTPGKAKGRAFTSTVSDSNIFAGTSRGAALSTLSHALEKLGVPPPGRPSTSLGFTRLDSANDDGGDGVSDVTQNGGKNKASNEGTVKGKGRANDDMCLPGATSTSMATSGIKRAGFARPTASSLKRSVTLSGLARRTGAGGSSIFPGVRSRDAGSGAGARHGRSTSGMFGRTGERASKNPSLPTVAGSPVKGSNPNGEESGIPTGGKEGGRQEGDDEQADAVESWDERGGGAGLDEGAQILDPSIDMTNASVLNFKADGGPPITSPSSSVDKGKQRTSLASSSLALNPASAALHALSESLSSLPQTPPATKPRVIGTRQGLRSASTAVNKTSPECGGPGSVPSNSNVVDANETKDAGFSGSIMSENAGGINGSGGAKKSSLKVLKKCAIFVDVRTDQGDDAGSLFVDMLRGLGAKIMGRVCQSCTHIVYKNGLPNTLARYRLLNDPKPFVVGIAWVVECVEQRARMDEEKYKVDVDLIDVASGNTKRRRSMLPRHLIPLSPANVDSFSLPANMSSEGDEEDVETGDMNESPSRDADTSIRSKDGDDLPPLERARRRRSVLPGGQTRLFA
ncbi:hypothetical protein BKA82DRAFT_454814 [Pisolithus tinctorius]|uniref:BRCT domain-containing protein n=1 Tax=Pisolithus tinctorius Marx 270 TaxID=870435 RepID=A0A0C3PX47_PISTI|nr:hypothetical protein BKA82DRAFT_454814 [Pisolithus tinctorius]KIO13991.1 hypothetical protein M404DRAFT_454814 [Pisolithus tinctorius Marx 270]